MQTFIHIEDFRVVADQKTMDIVSQTDSDTLNSAIEFAIDEISGYLRAADPAKIGRQPYDIEAAFSATGNDRNKQLVMYTCDCALYHLIAKLPQRMGFEIRQLRYEQAIDWLEKIQAGKTLLDIPELQADPEAQTPIRWGSWQKNKHDY